MTDQEIEKAKLINNEILESVNKLLDLSSKSHDETADLVIISSINIRREVEILNLTLEGY